ncbi:MAG: hypothetical protein K2K30_09000 [Alistipes sp.]|nr:hypothetical protein [Alistipes sp.]
MKKLLVMALTLLLSGAVQAQMDVTRFLGIPVDGSKSEMIRQLKEKGFRSTKYDNEILEGEFNGTEVQVFIVTNRNKVCRIMVADANSVNESDIKIRFNRLCSQFESNPNYISPQDQTIPEDEKISQEMTINKKRYQATFFQKPTTKDSLIIAAQITPTLVAKYTKEQLADITDDILSEVGPLANKLAVKHAIKKSVWFAISDKSFGQYQLFLYYDNEYNRANGEDL